MHVSLVPLDGGEPLLITLPLTLVGSDEECDIRLDAVGVAALQCVLAFTEDLVLLRDLNTDGIRVNGQRVRRAVLLPNDLLTIAGWRFRVQYESGGPEQQGWRLGPPRDS